MGTNEIKPHITISIPLENTHKKGNFFGHKVCYDCGQVYDARFPFCINCGSDVWDNLRSYQSISGRIFINESPKRLCTACKGVLKEDEHFEDLEGNEYCEECKTKVEGIAGLV